MVMVANRQSHYATSDMPAIKADSKQESRGRLQWLCNRRAVCQEEAAVSLSCTYRLAVCAALLIPAPEAKARIIDRTMLPISIYAGGHCDRKPDEVQSAPGTTTGLVDHNFRGFDFVTEGDILPPAIGLGFGLRVKLPGYGPGQPVTIEIKSPGGGKSTWDIGVPGTGVIEVGRLPIPGQSLPEGRYILTILDGQTLLIAYDFAIVGFDSEGLCTPAVS